MVPDKLDISDALDWEEGLPRPRWDLIESWVETSDEPDDQREAWTVAIRQWLAHLSEAFGGGFETVESEDFIILAPQKDSADGLLWFAGQCRNRLVTVLGSVANFEVPGKQVAIALSDADGYYRYVTPFFSEGEHGSSAGLQIRDGYPHVVLQGQHQWMLENVLSHELTHTALQHLAMPEWVEEGLAQMIEHDMTGRGLLVLDREIAEQHKRHWSKHGLDSFWRGEGFSRAGKVQELHYQLAEILMRLLVEDGRPRWFGWVREPQQRFFLFLQEATDIDCGAEACRECLGFELSDLAARFLGEGDWSPSL